MVVEEVGSWDHLVRVVILLDSTGVCSAYEGGDHEVMYWFLGTRPKRIVKLVGAALQWMQTYVAQAN